MTVNDIETTLAAMQHLLDHDYTHLEWRVMRTWPTADIEPVVYVHARTRDFRFRCRIDRPWQAARTAQALSVFVADIAAEAEHILADQVAVSP